MWWSANPREGARILRGSAKRNHGRGGRTQKLQLIPRIHGLNRLRSVRLLALLLTSVVCLSCRYQESAQQPDPETLRRERFGEHGEFLQNAERLEIFSLFPENIPDKDLPEEVQILPSNQKFHGFRFFGKLETTDPNEVNSVWADLHQRINGKTSTSIAYCFWPRHGIRAYRGDESRDYVICFQCIALRVYSPSQSDEHTYISLENDCDTSNLKMNELLDHAGIHRDLPPP